MRDVLPPDDAEDLHRDVVTALEQVPPTGGAHIMLAPRITRLLRS